MTTLSRSDAPTRDRSPAAGLPRHVRLMTAGWGWFMLAMAAVNGAMAAAGRSQLYVAFIDDTYVELYGRAWETLVAPQPLPWVLALTVFEAAVGAATLRGGRARLVGLAASAVFVAALTPASPYTLGNPVLAALPAYLLVRHVRTRRRPPPDESIGG